MSLSIVYDGSHSVVFIKANDSDTSSTPIAYSSYMRSWRDFGLVPTKRPSVSAASPLIHFVQIPGTSRRIDMTDLDPGGLKFGRRQGEWEFIIDSEKWNSFEETKQTLEEFLNGQRLYCVLEDDYDTAYRGRLKITDWRVGAGYSTVTISYDFEHNTYLNVFNIQRDISEQRILRSWVEVDNLIKDESYKTKVHVGDLCHLVIPGEFNGYMEVAGIDVDVDSNGNFIPITWIGKKSLNTESQYTPNGVSGSGGYPVCTKMQSHLDGIFELLPSRLKRMIKVAHKSCYDRSNYRTVYFDSKLWLPSCREVFGGSSYENAGPIYNGIFTSAASSRLRFSDTGPQPGSSTHDSWGLRSNSAYSGNYSVVYNTQNPGSLNGTASGNPVRIVPCFCTGSSS